MKVKYFDKMVRLKRAFKKAEKARVEVYKNFLRNKLKE